MHGGPASPHAKGHVDNMVNKIEDDMEEEWDDATHDYGDEVGGWRGKVLTVLEDKMTESFLLFLVVIDLLLLLVEIGLDLQIFCFAGKVMTPAEMARAAWMAEQSHHHAGHGLVMGPPTDGVDGGGHGGHGGGDAHGGGHFLLEMGTQILVSSAHNTWLMCDGSDGPNYHAVHHQASILSIAILGLFFFILLIKICLVPHMFIHNRMAMFDGFIVTTSFFFVAFLAPWIASFSPEMRTRLIGVSALLLCGRFLLVVRFVHTFVEVNEAFHEAYHEMLETLHEQVHHMESQIESVQDEIEKRKQVMAMQDS
mmetsp:Transcript_15665/g.37741  ORF Transcript_15665/g.37741 Transcript_15665/m.37741 type:complete len:310 (-) Transcript_15665:37-966(-)